MALVAFMELRQGVCTHAEVQRGRNIVFQYACHLEICNIEYYNIEVLSWWSRHPEAEQLFLFQQLKLLVNNWASWCLGVLNHNRKDWVNKKKSFPWKLSNNMQFPECLSFLYKKNIILHLTPLLKRLALWCILNTMVPYRSSDYQ